MNNDEFTISEKYIDTGDGHELYVQDWGYKDAKNPIVFLHGGPGSGVKDRYKQQFDPKNQRVVFFDQRGSGKSLPKGELKNNTTAKLVDDINLITTELKIKKFVITGGSWGSTLALVYGIHHPDKVTSMILRGIFTGRKSEIDFIEKGGYKHFYPDVWDQFCASVPKNKQKDPSSYHMKRLDNGSATDKKLSAYHYSIMEGSLLNLDDRFTPDPIEEFDESSSLIEMHYIKNNCFLSDNFVFENAHKLTMPIYLIQGRYDMVCPPITAYELNKVLPNSKLIWTQAGHGNDRSNHEVNSSLLMTIS